MARQSFEMCSLTVTLDSWIPDHVSPRWLPTRQPLALGRIGAAATAINAVSAATG